MSPVLGSPFILGGSLFFLEDLFLLRRVRVLRFAASRCSVPVIYFDPVGGALLLTGSFIR